MDPLPSAAADPDHARQIAAILSIRPDDSQPLIQFNPEQREAYEWAIQWLHDFNLGRKPEPGFSDEVLGRLSGYHETQMNAHFRQQQATAPPLSVQPEDSRLPPGAEAFIGQMLHNLNTHQPGVPRGQNVRNCPPPESSLEPPADDPLAEWTQRMLAGMKRMTEDPEYRSSIEKRIS